jgi:hypothetical protein
MDHEGLTAAFALLWNMRRSARTEMAKNSISVLLRFDRFLEVLALRSYFFQLSDFGFDFACAII